MAFTEDDYKTSYIAAFTPEQTLHLGAGALMPYHLERIVEITNKHGKIAIIGVGSTSILEMCIWFGDYATKLIEAKKVVDEIKGVDVRP